MISYRMEIVGGPFDGSPGMRWIDDGSYPPPNVILLGLCPGDGSCNAHQSAVCAKKGKRHPYYWTPEETTRPTRTTQYALHESNIDPDTNGPPGVTGRAVYVIGGITLPGDGEERELVGVGADGGDEVTVPSSGVYASQIVRDICRKYGINL